MSTYSEHKALQAEREERDRIAREKAQQILAGAAAESERSTTGMFHLKSKTLDAQIEHERSVGNDTTRLEALRAQHDRDLSAHILNQQNQEN